MSAIKTIFDMIVCGLFGFLILGPLGLMLGLILAAVLSVGRTMKPAAAKSTEPRQSWMENLFDRVLGKP